MILIQKDKLSTTLKQQQLKKQNQACSCGIEGCTGWPC
jgi:hypothetical protein